MGKIDWGEKLELKISKLPDSPGCYLMKDSDGTIIYVGKAVNLKNRVRSYFRDTYHTPKVAAMISHIDDFDILLCESNMEALCLECNLIKLHKPYYNILLKDDKHYPYIKINLKEQFPRLTIARRNENDGAKYFGPYIGVTAIRQVMDAVRDVFPMRNCAMSLPAKSPQRPCIQYDMKHCLAPCANLCSAEEYWDMMEGVISFLEGDYKEVLEQLRQSMLKASERMEYEKAALIRDQIRHVQAITERQIAIQTDRSEQDIVALYQDGIDAMVQMIYVRGGRMVGGDHFLLEGEGGEDKSEVISEFLTAYYDGEKIIPRNILASALPEDSIGEITQWLRQQKGSAVTVTLPKRGEKHELIMLAEKNAKDALEKRNARAAIQYERTVGACRKLGNILGLYPEESEKYPRRIEGYDISNTQGTLSVASMVVFIDGIPAKKEYRRFRIKTVQGANDFASMNEVLLRRFTRGLEEKEQGSGKFSSFPDLILIDGGPIQLRFAREAMQQIGVDVPIFGLAKREEEIYLPDRENPVIIDHHTAELQLVQRVRDEAHRFGITYHREIRDKAMTHSQLDDIKGIGPKRRKALMKKFGSIKAIRTASEEELLQVPEMNRTAADAVIAWQKQNQKQ